MKMNPLRQTMKLLFFSLKNAMNFQSLQKLCGSSTVEITYKFQREANFKQLSVGAWGTVINTGK